MPGVADEGVVLVRQRVPGGEGVREVVHLQRIGAAVQRFLDRFGQDLERDAHLVDAGMQQAAGEVAVLDRFPEVELGLAGVVFSATPTSSDDASATSKTRRSKGLVFTIESP